MINTRITDSSILHRELKPRLKSFLTQELQLKCKLALTVSATEEKHLDLEPDHGRGNKKVGKIEVQGENRKSQKVEREYFPLRYVKRATDVNGIHAHQLFLKGPAIISTAV